MRLARYFPPLDGLRAVSVLLVCTWHVDVVGGSVFTRLNGNMGVSVFFVLSGFLITLLALREESGGDRLDLRAFYVRRAFRILPLYFAVLGIYCLIILVLRLDPRRELFLEALPYYLLYVQEFAPPAPFRLSWSLGIEEKFYLLWPVLAFWFAATSRRRMRIALVAIPLLILPAVVARRHDELLQPYGCILLGCVVAMLSFAPGGAARLSRLAAPAVGYAAAALLVVALVVVPSGSKAALAGIAAAVAIPGLVASRYGIARLLSGRVMTWLGRLSYAIYLTNQLCMGAARKLVPGTRGALHDWSVLAVGLMLCIPVSAALHYALERPMIRLGRQYAGVSLRARARLVAADAD